MAIFEGEANWQEKAQQILEAVHNSEPHYYYASATLGQVYHFMGDADKAQGLFRHAYETIERSGDLQKVTETRSKILLLMVVGLCCKHGLPDEKRAGEYLDNANNLRARLPKLGDQVCTVFSILSRKNENSETIRSHIDLIRKGEVFLRAESL